MMQKKVEVGDTMEVSVRRIHFVLKYVCHATLLLHDLFLNVIRLRYYLLRWFSLCVRCSALCRRLPVRRAALR